MICFQILCKTLCKSGHIQTPLKPWMLLFGCFRSYNTRICADKLNIMRLQINIREKKSNMSRLNMLPLGLVYQDLLKTYTIVTNPNSKDKRLSWDFILKAQYLQNLRCYTFFDNIRLIFRVDFTIWKSFKQHIFQNKYCVFYSKK